VSASPSPAAQLQPLFQPFRIRDCVLPNRIVMAPMTRRFVSDLGTGAVAESAIAYYRRRAEGGVGLILSEGIGTSELGAYTATVPRLDTAPAIAMWKRVTDAVHGAGARMMAQLWHTGLGRLRQDSRDPLRASIGPMEEYLPEESPLRAAGGSFASGRAMSLQDIGEAIEEYGRAAAAAQQAGFDGIELHAAHGYLIDQFFWAETNRRQDGYGGSLKQRSRFACEVLQSVRRHVGPHLPVGVRFSQWKLPTHFQARLVQSPQELEALLGPLVDAGADFFDASTRRYWDPAFEGSELTLAGWTKKVTGRPSMAVGSVGLNGPMEPYDRNAVVAPQADIGRIVAMLERGEVDLVVVGRALIANPDWVAKVRRGELADLKPYEAGSLSRHW